jgi:hypothetical protein
MYILYILYIPVKYQPAANTAITDGGYNRKDKLLLFYPVNPEYPC